DPRGGVRASAAAADAAPPAPRGARHVRSAADRGLTAGRLRAGGLELPAPGGSRRRCIRGDGGDRDGPRDQSRGGMKTSPVSALQPPSGTLSPHLMIWPSSTPKVLPLRSGFSDTVRMVPTGNASTVTP